MKSVIVALSKQIDALNDYSYWLYEAYQYQLGFMAGFFASFLLKLEVVFIDMYDAIVSKAINITVQLYDLAHISDAINAMNAFNSSGYGYFSSYFGISTLFTSVLSAYLIRFGIRRLPIIG